MNFVRINRNSTGTFFCCSFEHSKILKHVQNQLSPEKNIRREHFPRCPRQRRMVSRESETAQVTFRHSKDSFCAYEAQRGKCFIFACIGVVLNAPDDPSLDVVDTAVEGWVLQDLLLPSGLSLNWTTAKFGCPRLARETSTRFARFELVHSRHSLPVRALSEQSLVFKGIFEGKHINPWELEYLITFVRLVRRARVQPRRLLILVDSRMAPGTASKERSSPVITFLLRELGFWVVRTCHRTEAGFGCRLGRIWQTHCQRVRLNRARFAHQPMPSLLRKPLSAAVTTKKCA